MSWLETKYVNLLSCRFQNFKRKSSTLWNFTCPFCRDNANHPKKARGYIFEKNNNLFYFCHKCNESMGFPKFLKRVDSRLFSEFSLEKIKMDRTPEDVKAPILKLFDTPKAWNALIKLKKISQLPVTHPAKLYITERQIPTPYHAIFRWCPKFLAWTNELVPGKFDMEKQLYDSGRIIIPFFNEHNHFFAYQGRSLSNSDKSLRYIGIALNNEPMIFGLNTVDKFHQIKVVEGPLDATFLTNCLAIAGSNYNSLTKIFDAAKLLIIYDNEPHSSETRTKIQTAIEQGLQVVIFPDNVVQKDINKMVTEGKYTPEHLEYIITNNTFSGLKAKMRLTQWSKV